VRTKAPTIADAMIQAFIPMRSDRMIMIPSFEPRAAFRGGLSE
jgi:hypothetical protein